ncbi:anti-sigma factor [Caldilinea sp.]|uniref:anti-sigma factor family protein n=1 Tax=Caldilinea sp. TaxID=2293560 RepID=UPI0021DEEB1D|nr:hypothetical protein [Caldilinea sp.]GIV70479.1 MAG: hypothetical protein KatS3mg048_3341 [Caldilinea sp.]
MTTSRYPEITDELLSAYIDNAVSEEERALIERAILDDASVAWRLATLQETVRLLRNLPLLQAPRSFALTRDQVGQPLHEPAPVVGVVTAEPRSVADARRGTPSPRSKRWSEWFEGWRRFWRAGSPIWRNAMAASMALLLVTLILPTFLTIEQPPAAMLSDAAVSSIPAATEMAQPAALAAPDRRDEMEATDRQIDSPAQEASPALQPTEAPVSAAAVAAAAVEEPSSVVASSATASNVQPQGAALPAASEAEGAAFGGSYADPLQSMRTGSGMAPMHTEGSIASGPGEVRPAAVPPAAALARESAQDVAAETAPQAPEGAPPIASPMIAETAQPVLTPEAEHAPDEVAPVLALDEATSGAESLDRSKDFAPQQEATATSVEESAEATLATGEAQTNATLGAPPASQERTAVASLPAAVVAFLHWLRLGAAGALVVFGLLWWRSRRN